MFLIFFYGGSEQMPLTLSPQLYSTESSLSND